MNEILEVQGQSYKYYIDKILEKSIHIYKKVQNYFYKLRNTAI